MFEFFPTPLQDALIIKLPQFIDERGNFTKTFQNSIFLKEKLNFKLMESYFSLSKKGVIRGMHFQTPPHQHAKIVFCPCGEIEDVIIDLRKNSPTFLKHFSIKLSSENHHALYIPEGFAHGFQSLKDDSMTYYLVSSEYSKESDTGIKWDSFNYDWKTTHPIISERDQSFESLTEFKSPF